MAARFAGPESRVAEFRAELETWYRTRPPVPTDAARDALVLFGCEDWFSTNYSFTILLLYRAQLADRSAAQRPDTVSADNHNHSDDNDDDDSVFLDCFTAAGDVCRRYRRQFVGRAVGYTWQALHFLFLAGLTYLHCLWTSRAVRRHARHDRVSGTCTDCTLLLAVMAERWEGVAPYRDIFEALAARTLTMLVERGAEDQGALAVPAAVGTAAAGAETSALLDGAGLEDDGLDWDQWIADITDTGMSGTVDKLLTDLRGSPL